MPVILIFVLSLLLASAFKVRYVFSYILKWKALGFHLQKDYSYEPVVSILIPCYNESAGIYDTVRVARASNYPLDKLEIVIQDDGSTDDSYQHMERAQRDFPNVIIGRNVINSKKPVTIMNALKASKGEIVVEVDSDSHLDKDAVRELVACFKEPGIGAVGGMVMVMNPSESTITMAQTLTYYLQQHLTKPLENWSRSVSVVSGCMLAIKRELLEEIDPIIRARNWFGIPVAEGEDRKITQEVLKRGFTTYMNADAKCWTEVPVTMRQLWNQQLRWRRGSLRNYFSALRWMPFHAHKLHPNTLYTVLMPTTASLIAIVSLMTLIHEYDLWVAPIAMVIAAAVIALFDIATAFFTPSQRVSHPLRLVALVAWVPVNVLLTILALCTFDQGQNWGTR